MAKKKRHSSPSYDHNFVRRVGDNEKALILGFTQWMLSHEHHPSYEDMVKASDVHVHFHFTKHFFTIESDIIEVYFRLSMQSAKELFNNGLILQAALNCV